MPVRIQRRRVKGWRMPENTVSVTRPGRWGNPFVAGNFYKISRIGWLKWIGREMPPPNARYIPDAAAAVAMYREYLGQLAFPPSFEVLRGKNADILLELANRRLANRRATA